jgi:hypothetical protein
VQKELEQVVLVTNWIPKTIFTVLCHQSLFVDKHILGTHSAVEDTKASPVFFLHKWMNSVYIATSSRREKHFLSILFCTNAPISFGRAYSTLEDKKTISSYK